MNRSTVSSSIRSAATTTSVPATSGTHGQTLQTTGGGPACEAFEARLNHWIDAGADAEIDEDQHLVSCPHCQQTLTIWRQLEMGVRTPEGGWNASSVKPSFARKAARWSVTLAACFFAVIVLRPPGNQLPVDQADSGVGSTSDGVQWKGAAPISNSSGFSGNGSLASDLSNEGSGLARENDSAEAFLAADDVAVEAASDESILLARWIAQSRPTVAQLSVGVAPLGRTLQRTANLFY